MSQLDQGSRIVFGRRVRRDAAHEVARDLQLVQVAGEEPPRDVCGSDRIKGDVPARRDETAQGIANGRIPGMEGPRGDLETESGRIRSELPHEPERIVDKGSVNELGTGHVDGDADPQTVPAPLGRLADGLVDDPAPQGVELACFFRDPDELGGVDQSATAPPAKERLDAPALAATQVDDRLVMKDEIVLL